MTADVHMKLSDQKRPMKSIFLGIKPESSTMHEAFENGKSKRIPVSYDRTDCKGPFTTLDGALMTLPDGRVSESVPRECLGRKVGMNEESNRRRTFQNWPQASPVSATNLARAGFYYTGARDAVKCFSCGGQVEGWEFGDTAMGEHKRLFPHCDFASEKSTNNVSLLGVKERPELTREVSRIEQSQRDIERRAREKAAEIEKVEPREMTRNFLTSASSGLNSSSSTKDDTVEEKEERSSLLFGKYNQEHVRLQSFRNWPRTSPIEPRDLAKAGFYYLNRDDAVQCFACYGEISRWKPCDVPAVEHKTHFPNCPFVKGLDVGNEPISTPPVTRHVGSAAPLRSFSTPTPTPDQLHAARFLQQQRNLRAAMRPLNNCKHPKYVQEAARLETFRFWPRPPPGLHTIPSVLAKAGFFYTGNADECKCFYCGGGLKNWEPMDEPWTEHAKWFPRCEWLIQQRGQAFITHVQKVKPPPISSPPVMNFKPPSFGTEEPYTQVEPPHRFKASYLERQHPDTSKPSTPLTRPAAPPQGIPTPQALPPPKGKPQKEMTIEEEKEAALREFKARGLEPEAAAEVVFKPRTKKVEEVEPSTLRSKVDEKSNASDFIQNFMSSPTANMVVEMGYPSDLIHLAATRHFSKTSREFSSPDELLESIWAVQDQGVHPTPSGGKAVAGIDVDYLRKPPKDLDSESSEVSSQILDIQAEKLAGLSLQDEAVSTSMPEDPTTPATPISSLQTQQGLSSQASNQSSQSSMYQDNQLCKICLDRELNTVFLPCKHLATCSECAKKVSECPMCRQPIINSLNIYMS